MNSSTTRKKRKLILEIEKNPIITYACQKVGVSRATFYRWKDEDADFTTEIEDAQSRGYDYLNDFAEGKLISKIKNEDGPSIRFWLVSNHNRYRRVPGGKNTGEKRQFGWAEMVGQAMAVLKGTDVGKDK
jgi:hypothetical protein